jgi:Glycosyl hydrolase family 12
MRKVALAWYLGSALLLLACGDGNTNGGGCDAGSELCNGQCVPTGSCTSGCPTGQSLCNGACAAIGSCQGSNPCAVGQVYCNGACYVGSICPSTSTTPSTGGQSTIGQSTATLPHTGGVGSTTSAKPPTGGTTGTTPATGGKTATGGTTAATTTAAQVDNDPSTCTDTATLSVTMKAQYQTTYVSTNYAAKNYAATSNWWSVFNGQTAAINGLGLLIQNPNNATSSNGSDPIGFPALMIGQYQKLKTKGSNLPKLVSSLTTIPTVFNTNIGSISNNDLNSSMDVWFNTSSDPLSETAGAPTGGYLMVWQHKPGSKQPRGSIVMPDASISGAPGKWNVWSDGKCVSYVSSTVQGSLTFDLNAFIKHAASNNHVVKSNWYLAAIFAGFEIWSGGNGANMSKFCVKVN